MKKNPKERPDMKLIQMRFPAQVKEILKGIKRRVRPSTAISYKKRKQEQEKRKQKLKKLEKYQNQSKNTFSLLNKKVPKRSMDHS